MKTVSLLISNVIFNTIFLFLEMQNKHFRTDDVRRSKSRSNSRSRSRDRKIKKSRRDHRENEDEDLQRAIELSK